MSDSVGIVRNQCADKADFGGGGYYFEVRVFAYAA